MAMIPKNFQVKGSVREKHLRSLVPRDFQKVVGDLLKLMYCLLKPVSVRGYKWTGQARFDCLPDLLQIYLISPAVLHHDLAAQQIQTMDARGPFVDRMNPAVAIELFQGKFIAISISPEDLQALATGDNAHFRRIGFGHRCQKIQEQGAFFSVFSLFDSLVVGIQRTLEEQSQGTFHYRPLEKQHPFDVGMLNYGYRLQTMGLCSQAYGPGIFL